MGKRIKYPSLSAAQSEAIKKRDNYTCAFQALNICMGLCQERLETHHITPKAKSEKWEPENDPNRGLNLITLCLGAHSRIHPNLIESRKRIPKGIEQINRCIKLNRQGKPYHNTDWDEQMRQLAIDNEIALANLSVEEAWKE